MTGVCAIGATITATVTPCPCQVHARLDPVYHGTRCGTQTFELAVMQKNFPAEHLNDPELREIGSICKTTKPFHCHVHAIFDPCIDLEA